MRVSPEPEAIELLRRYRLALNYAINKILSLNLKTVRKVHRELYRELRGWFGSPFREALAAIGACRRNPYRGKRSRVKNLGMVRYLEKGYMNQSGCAEIMYGIKLKISERDRRYDR